MKNVIEGNVENSLRDDTNGIALEITQTAFKIIFSLVSQNKKGVLYFLRADLIELLSDFLEKIITTSLSLPHLKSEEIKDDEKRRREFMKSIPYYICSIFKSCSEFTFNHSFELVKKKVIQKMMYVLENHASLKVAKMLHGETMTSASCTLNNVFFDGYNEGEANEKNKFDSPNLTLRLLNIFTYFYMLNPATDERKELEMVEEVKNNIARSIVFLFKNKKHPPSFDLVLDYICDHVDPKAWNAMIDPDSVRSSMRKKDDDDLYGNGEDSDLFGSGDDGDLYGSDDDNDGLYEYKNRIVFDAKSSKGKNGMNLSKSKKLKKKDITKKKCRTSSSKNRNKSNSLKTDANLFEKERNSELSVSSNTHLLIGEDDSIHLGNENSEKENLQNDGNDSNSF
jgi:hypothetical protein